MCGVNPAARGDVCLEVSSYVGTDCVVCGHGSWGDAEKCSVYNRQVSVAVTQVLKH